MGMTGLGVMANVAGKYGVLSPMIFAKRCQKNLDFTRGFPVATCDYRRVIVVFIGFPSLWVMMIPMISFQHYPISKSGLLTHRTGGFQRFAVHKTHTHERTPHKLMLFSGHIHIFLMVQSQCLGA
jgi:hypothetical protein